MSDRGVGPQGRHTMMNSRWIVLQMGYAATALTSDVGRGGPKGTFTMAFCGGRALGERVRVGLELGGWLLEASDVWDPSTGESVSQMALIVQVSPLARSTLYVEGGVGITTYTNHRPPEFGGRGTGWSCGAGWNARLPRSIRLVPSVNLSGGRLRDIENVLVVERGLRYAVWDVRLGLIKDFGRTRD